VIHLTTITLRHFQAGSGAVHHVKSRHRVKPTTQGHLCKTD
jgi:hypothetical protein